MYAHPSVRGGGGGINTKGLCESVRCEEVLVRTMANVRLVRLAEYACPCELVTPNARVHTLVAIVCECMCACVCVPDVCNLWCSCA